MFLKKFACKGGLVLFDSQESFLVHFVQQMGIVGLNSDRVMTLQMLNSVVILNSFRFSILKSVFKFQTQTDITISFFLF